MHACVRTHTHKYMDKRINWKRMRQPLLGLAVQSAPQMRKCCFVPAKALFSWALSFRVKWGRGDSPVWCRVKLLALMWLHGNSGLLMNTTYPLWFESFHPVEKIQKASLPAPAAFLYPSQWFTPTQLLYLINKHLTTAAGLGVLTLERPRQAWAGHQLWQQETAPETTLRKQQLQKPKSEQT